MKNQIFRDVESCKKKIMPLFYATYRMLDDSAVRSDCTTLFGGMTAADDAKELGPVKLLGRWAAVGACSGYCVFEAPTARAVNDWLVDWTCYATIAVTPALDDNGARVVILGAAPKFEVDSSHVGDEAKEGESLYAIEYTFLSGCKSKGYNVFANMEKKMSDEDPGENTLLGRWHNLGSGSGLAICSSGSVEELYAWTMRWSELCDCTIVPVLTDAQARESISAKPSFAKKHAALMDKLAGKRRWW